jgi:hypothetical protein
MWTPVATTDARARRFESGAFNDPLFPTVDPSSTPAPVSLPAAGRFLLSGVAALAAVARPTRAA